MSIFRFASVLAALVTALALAPNVAAQNFKAFDYPELETDFQFFAPADIETFGGGPDRKTGWFATFDRVYMNMSRPRDAYVESRAMGDFTWGNRFDLGYVDDDCHGWVFTGWHIDGPNHDDLRLVQRLNFDTSNGQNTGNDTLRLTRNRHYLTKNSINVADISGLELNRTWLWKPLHGGGQLQPFAGVRYIKFVDFYHRDVYARYDDEGVLIPNLPPDPATGVGAKDATTETLAMYRGGTINDMVGGQLGMRWDKEVRRWNVSAAFKAFALQNFQNWDLKVDTEQTMYGGTIPQTGDPDGTIHSQVATAGSRNEFVFGCEVRTDAAFRVTRDFSLRFGFEFMDLGKGIGRGTSPDHNDQGVIMYGLTFGGTINR